MATTEQQILEKMTEIDNVVDNLLWTPEERETLTLSISAFPLLKRMINRDANKMTLFDKANNAYRPQSVSDLSFVNDNGVIKLDASAKPFNNYVNNLHSAININSSDEDKTPPITFDFKYNKAGLSKNTVFINNQLVEVRVRLQNKILEIQNLPRALITYFLNTCSPQLIAQ